MIWVPISSLLWTGEKWGTGTVCYGENTIFCRVVISLSALLQGKVVLINTCHIPAAALEKRRLLKHHCSYCLCKVPMLVARLCSSAVCIICWISLYREVFWGFSPSRFLAQCSHCTTAVPWEVPSPLLIGSEFFAYCSTFKWGRL